MVQDPTPINRHINIGKDMSLADLVRNTLYTWGSTAIVVKMLAVVPTIVSMTLSNIPDQNS